MGAVSNGGRIMQWSVGLPVPSDETAVTQAAYTRIDRNRSALDIECASFWG